MLLVNQGQYIQAVMSAAITTVEPKFYTEWIDRLQDTSLQPGNLGGAFNGVTPVQCVVSGYSSGKNVAREIEEMQFFNADTAAVTITISFFDGTTLWPVKKSTLNAGQTLVYQRTFGWEVE